MQCQYRKNEKQCRCNAQKGQLFCYFHFDKEKLKKNSAIGGMNKKKLAEIEKLDSIDDLKKLIAEIILKLCQSQSDILSRSKVITLMSQHLATLFEDSCLLEKLEKLEKHTIDKIGSPASQVHTFL